MSSSSLLEKCCLIGESVTGNPTHFMVEQAFEDAGIDWRFLTFEVSQTQLVDALRGLSAMGFGGAILLPSLQRMSWEHLSAHTERSQASRSASCLVRRDGRLVADDLSGESVVAAIVRTHPVAGRNVLLLGVGGRAGPAAHAVLQHGAASLRIADPSGNSGEDLATELRASHPDAVVETIETEHDQIDPPDDINLVIASSAWSKPKDVSVARMMAPWLTENMVVADARVRSGNSPLLHDAIERGAMTVCGIQILVEEVAESIRLWTGVEVSRSVLQDAAEEFLGV